MRLGGSRSIHLSYEGDDPNYSTRAVGTHIVSLSRRRPRRAFPLNPRAMNPLFRFHLPARVEPATVH